MWYSGHLAETLTKVNALAVRPLARLTTTALSLAEKEPSVAKAALRLAMAEANHSLDDPRALGALGALGLGASLMEAAVILEDKESAEVLLGQLSGVAPLVEGLTSYARHLGAASGLLGRPNEARAYYNQALEVCDKIRFRPEIALIRLGLAELLLDHYPNERPAAIEHLDFAIAEFGDMKMQPSLERALRHREFLRA